MKNKEFRISMRGTAIISLIAFLLGICGFILSYNVKFEDMRGPILYLSTLNMIWLPLIPLIQFVLLNFCGHKGSFKEIFSKKAYNEFTCMVIPLMSGLVTIFLIIFTIIALIP